MRNKFSVKIKIKGTDLEMSFCERHQNDIRFALKDRGIFHLVGKDGMAAAKNIEKELSGGRPQLDPFLACQYMIIDRTIECGGIDDLMLGCPICTAVKNGADEEDWINGPADAALQGCMDRGLCSPAS